MIHLIYVYFSTLVFVKAADVTSVEVFGSPNRLALTPLRHRGPATWQSESRMNWLVGLVGGRGCARVCWRCPHYAVDYPLLSTATVTLLSPLLWG